MGAVGLILMIILCPNPPRGAAETHGEGVTEQSSYLEDVKYLLKKYDLYFTLARVKKTPNKWCLFLNNLVFLVL